MPPFFEFQPADCTGGNLEVGKRGRHGAFWKQRPLAFIDLFASQIDQ